MKFAETKLKGAFVIELEKHLDPRGFFARTFCMKEFAAYGLKTDFVQCNTSFNYLKGTLRGMHYQLPPSSETKLIRCVQGSVHYVLIDMRPDSLTYTSHLSVELESSTGDALYVPEMFAIGYQTLRDDTEVFYQMGEFYTPECQAGIRYDDPYFGIRWPLAVTQISDKDLSWPLFQPVSVAA